MANRQTSDAISSIAAKYLHFGQADLTALDEAGQAEIVTAVRALAASALSQDETKGKRKTAMDPALGAPYGSHDQADLLLRQRYGPAGEDVLRTNTEAVAIHGVATRTLAEIMDERRPAAGTSAYELIAASAQQHVEVTETLIQMVAATVLMKMDQLSSFDPFEPLTVSFSPADMDEMYRLYDMTAKRDGMVSTISIRHREEAETRPSLALHVHQGIDPEEPAKPQADVHVFDRPLWATRIDGVLYPASDKEQAENRVAGTTFDQVAQIENRFCYHTDCPAEHCNHAELSGVEAIERIRRNHPVDTDVED